MFYIKPNLKNMSQGARLEYIREVRHMTKEDVQLILDLEERNRIKQFVSTKTILLVQVQVDWKNWQSYMK